jgi:hypothetical protein
MPSAGPGLLPLSALYRRRKMMIRTLFRKSIFAPLVANTIATAIVIGPMLAAATGVAALFFCSVPGRNGLGSPA